MIRLKITGMTCGHCEQSVNKALAAVPGVERVVEVDRETQQALVEGHADVAALIAAVAAEGYQAKVAA